ncbi:hypothetical protein QJQ45_020461 [Haematococcus lacustris]|nr:hypothetical protein QJQ45_020461 [Haematococcus lacustris]
MEDSEISLPKATIVKLIKDALPAQLRIAGDASDMIIACCTEFVNLVSSEANEVATRENKQTIQPEHVLQALNELGFADFTEEVTDTWNCFKEEAKASHTQKANLRKTGADHAGLTEEQQIILQQQMFAAARAASMTSADNATAMAAMYQAQLAALGQKHALAAQSSVPLSPVMVSIPVPGLNMCALPSCTSGQQSSVPLVAAAATPAIAPGLGPALEQTADNDLAAHEVPASML